jgi:bifunctional oligoribonuclease and PAP phosphatase NrnA
VSSDVVALLRSAERVTAICHENPDADTLGAGLAIRLIAERLGKIGEVVCADEPPPMLSFMPRVEEVRRSPALDPDVAVIVDAGSMSRTGSIAADWADWLERSRIINIDHHVSNPGFGAVQLIDAEAAATCEIIAGLLPELGVELDLELATVLMAGIAADTHTFAHPNATPRTLRVAAELLEAGAPLSAINRALYVDRPFGTVALWGQVLADVEQRCAGRLVHAALTSEMLARTGTDPTASEGLIDMLAAVRSADIAVLFKEAEPNLTRVSVRTSARADAVAITAAFGGGGHARAAGCSVAESLPRARELVLAECERELARSDAGRR